VKYDEMRRTIRNLSRDRTTGQDRQLYLRCVIVIPANEVIE